MLLNGKLDYSFIFKLKNVISLIYFNTKNSEYSIYPDLYQFIYICMCEKTYSSIFTSILYTGTGYADILFSFYPNSIHAHNQ